MVRRSHDEWRDYLFYIPAALGGRCQLVRPELRADLIAVIQILLVLVATSRGRKSYSAPELRKTYSEIFGTMYHHIDNMGRTIFSAPQGSDAADDDERSDGVDAVFRKFHFESSNFRKVCCPMAAFRFDLRLCCVTGATSILPTGIPR